MKFIAVWVLIGCSFLWARSNEKPAKSLIITNVNVVDTRYGGIIPNVTVAIKDGSIIAVAKIAVLDTGPNVQIVNATGKYLIPGLWDMSARLSGNAAWDRRSLLILNLANGVTGLRDIGRRDPDNSDRTSLTSFEPEFATPIGVARSSSRETPLTERRVIEDLDEVLSACSAKEQEVKENLSDKDSGSFSGTIANRSDGAPESCDPKKSHNLFLAISDHATWMLPALVSFDATADRSSDVVSAYTPVSLRSPATAPQDAELLKQEMNSERHEQLVRDMHRVGVQFLAGTGAPATNLMPGFALHSEMGLLVKSGLSPLEALQAATFNPALSMIKLDKFGVVEAGHVADLVLLDANPLEDIANTRKISAVVLRGAYYSRSDLDSLLSEEQQWASQQVDKSKAADLAVQ